MFGHTSRNNGQGKVSLRPQQEMEDLSEEAQPVGSARTRSLLLAGPTVILTLGDEPQVNTWLEALRKGPQEEFDYSHYANMKPENASHSCQASIVSSFGPLKRSVGICEEAQPMSRPRTRRLQPGVTWSYSLLRRYRWTLIQLEFKICRCNTFDTHTTNCLPPNAIYFYLAWWLATSGQGRLTPGFGFNYHILGKKKENWW